MNSTQNDNDIYLNLQFRKSKTDSSEYGKTDEFGNYIFEVEASNENLDLQNQIVLQNALLESKKNFIQHGVISYDHQHKQVDENGKAIVDNSMIIGEPIDVKTDGKRTVVVGKLYKSNKHAQEFIRLLKDGSTRVRASVGGIFPKIIKDKLTGVERIAHVLWNDLALTCMPVNNSVGSASFVKSLNPEEFIKALAAGYETDSKEKTNGNALIEEDTERKTIDVTPEQTNLVDNQKKLIRSLVKRLESGEITGKEQAEQYLESKGIDKDLSRQIIREIIEQGGQIMKSSFSSRIKEMMKSFAGNQKDKDEDIDDEDEDATPDVDDDSDDDVLNLDDDSGEDESEENDDEDTEKSTKKSCKKSNDTSEEDEDVVDGSEVLKALSDEITSIRKSINSISKQYKDLGNAVVSLAEMVQGVGNEKLPQRSASFSKSLGAKSSGNVEVKLTKEGYERAQDVLCEGVKSGEITLTKSAVWNSEIQKSIALGTKLSSECYSFLKRKMDSK